MLCVLDVRHWMKFFYVYDRVELLFVKSIEKKKE